MRLKRLREDQGITQETLAKKAGISRVYVARLETGKQDPTLGTLTKLAKALKVKVGELLGESIGSSVAKGVRMGWEPIGVFAGFQIWVTNSDGSWIASVEALPKSGGVFTAGPGEDVIPGKFATVESAKAAARNYIIQKRNSK